MKRKQRKVNPVAKALWTPECRQRIVKSKLTYNRKHKHKGCDNLSHLFTNDFA